MLDHVIPVAEGGTDKPDNLITACETCNHGKATALLDPSVRPMPARFWTDTEINYAVFEYMDGWIGYVQDTFGGLPLNRAESTWIFRRIGPAGLDDVFDTILAPALTKAAEQIRAAFRQACFERAGTPVDGRARPPLVDGPISPTSAGGASSGKEGREDGSTLKEPEP